MAGKNLGRVKARAELPRTAHKIGMNVRLENMCNGHARLSRHVDVNVAVRPRIEHRRHAIVVVAYEIGKFGDALCLNGLEDE